MTKTVRDALGLWLSFLVAVFVCGYGMANDFPYIATVALFGAAWLLLLACLATQEVFQDHR